MTTKEPFVIASDVQFKDPLELDLHNLKMRLKIFQDYVAETEAQIASVEERLKQK